jgi:single-stranded DNA-binding protein
MPVAKARLGQTYRFSRNDKPAEHTNWFGLVFYGDLANLAMKLEKGTNLYVEGTFDQRPYMSLDKNTRYIYEVSVDKFFVIGGLPQAAPDQSASQALFKDEVLNDGAPTLESSESQDWLL